MRLKPRPLRRIYIAILSAAILYAIFALGSLTEMNDEEAERKMDELDELLPDSLSIESIFLNNFLISLIMLIPLLGPALGGYIVYNTGTFLAAIAVSMNTNVILLLVVPLLTVYGFLEFLGYGVMTSESVLLIYAVIAKRLREELRVLPLIIGITASILGIAALIELGLIALSKGLGM